MSTMSDLIQMYLDRISPSCKEIYEFIDGYTLGALDRQKWGFPLGDPKCPKRVTRIPCPAFDSSPDPKEQTCRCGKLLSLLKKDWYIDDAGCSYHWGKRSFWGGPENGLFSCCKGISEKDGCMRHKYHACSYKPMKSDGFASTQFIINGKLSCTNIFALDCEMVYTTVGLEVARVSLVTICGKTMYDSFVQPPNPILDFNTSFSGIRSQDLNGVTTTAADARASILKLLNQDSILIGHGLENDLVSLHLLHDKLVDTSILYAHEKGFPYRHSLKTLACKYLKKVIHSDMNGHNSVEDAKTCIALVLHKVEFDKRKPAVITSSKCDFTTLSGPYSTFKLITFPDPLVNHFHSRNLSYQKSPVLIIPKIVRFETAVFPTISRPQFPYSPMALCQY